MKSKSLLWVKSHCQGHWVKLPSFLADPLQLDVALLPACLELADAFAAAGYLSQRLAVLILPANTNKKLVRRQ